MKFAYITKVDISAKSAQARQISSMSKAFNDSLGQDFILVSAGSNQEIDFNHKTLKIKKVRVTLPRGLFNWNFWKF